ncbi:MAG: hypothetical protein P1U37_03855, partial [Minwuia sp.]|nr:hypothetical protein [Minwuia sp.]
NAPADAGAARASAQAPKPAAQSRVAEPAPRPAPAPGNVDTSLRDRINRLSTARNNLLRRRGATVPAEEPVTTATAPQRHPVETAQPEPVPAFDVPEDVEIETTTEEAVGEVDLTRPMPSERPAPSSPPEPAERPVAAAPRPDDRNRPPRESETSHPRQSARRRGAEERTETARDTAAADTSGLPATRRNSTPDMAQSTVREVSGSGRADASAMMSEVETLRREIADLRREVRDLREAGPGGLGPVERAVQRLSQRMDRLDGGAQPLIADGQLEMRKPKRSGLLGWFTGRR